MKKIFTLCITLLGLTCMTPAFAQTRLTAVFAPITDITTPTPTDVITTPAYPMDGRMYDVLGRRIRTSVNGQIYIVNGEKHIRQ